jgi:hypothetical protein
MLQPKLAMARPSLKRHTLGGRLVVLSMKGLLKMGHLITSAWDVGLDFVKPIFTYTNTSLRTNQKETQEEITYHMVSHVISHKINKE